MDLKQWRDIASDYVEGTLPAEKMKEVRAFLATSPEARTDEALLRGITRHLNDLPEVDPPLFFADNVISRIEREREEAKQRGWRAWIPNVGRLAVGSLAAGGVMAALAWNFFNPKTVDSTTRAGLIPGVTTKGSVSTPVGSAPVLKLTNLQSTGTAVKVYLTLENAKSGIVLASVPGATQQTGVSLGGEEPVTRPLEVPVGEGMDVRSFKLAWSAEGTQGEQWVITPLLGEKPAATRLSFGMGEMPLTPQALEEVARRYGQGITVSDVPQSERKVQFDARNETLEELLTRHLGPQGMIITRAENRVVVTAKR
jgi:hypothetical protein